MPRGILANVGDPEFEQEERSRRGRRWLSVITLGLVAALLVGGAWVRAQVPEAAALSAPLPGTTAPTAALDSAAADLAEQLQLPIIGPHEGDQYWIDALPQTAINYGFPPARVFTPTRWLQDGDTVQLGQSTLQVRHCPGHTPGHVVFHSAEANRAFVGDVLFAGSIGRTDFPGGDYDTLIASITQRLWPMGNDTVFIPGHGPESTFGRERVSNPFVAGT